MTEEAVQQRLTQLWLEHADAVRRFARRRVPDDEVDDVLAETFTVAWRRIGEVPDHALPWLYGVARNVIRTGSRSRGRRAALADKVARQPLEEASPAEVEAVERVHLVRAWGQLTEAEREVIALVAWEGLSSTEAAKVMECLPSTFAVRLLRARRRLAHLLERGSLAGDRGVARAADSAAEERGK